MLVPKGQYVRRLNNLRGRHRLTAPAPHGNARPLNAAGLADWNARLALLRGEGPPPPYAEGVRLLRAMLTKLD